MENLKEAVAVAVPSPHDQSRLLLVRRPEAPGEELPGLWGLPAASLGAGEDDAAALERLGRQKLGAEVRPLRLLAQGRAQRADYTLVMRLYQALLAGEPRLGRRSADLAAPDAADQAVTLYTQWRWGEPAELREGAERGSLCCRLYLHLLAAARPE